MASKVNVKTNGVEMEAVEGQTALQLLSNSSIEISERLLPSEPWAH